MGSQCLSMKSGNSVLSLFLLGLLVSLLLPEADCWGVRGRVLANRRIARKGPVRRSQGQRQRKQAGRPLRRRGKEDTLLMQMLPPLMGLPLLMQWLPALAKGLQGASVRYSCSTEERAHTPSSSYRTSARIPRLEAERKPKNLLRFQAIFDVTLEK